MRTLRLIIRYDGTRYKGWQRLGDDERTIQHKLETALSRILGEVIEIDGAGRTDSGVHALAQVASFHTRSEMPVDGLQAALDEYLPEDIAVTRVEDVEPRFHARLHATGKTYLYRIDDGAHPDPFLRKTAWHVPGPLDVKAMRHAAAALVGTHDFASFTTLKPGKKSLERTVTRIDANRRTAEFGAQVVDIEFEGDGFLWNMVRIVAGTLALVGAGDLAPAAVPGILAAKHRPAAGPTAPPQGLFLVGVRYGGKLSDPSR